jgi:SAM-dependent methyltransferase
MGDDGGSEEQGRDGAVPFDNERLRDNLHLANIHHDGNRPGRAASTGAVSRFVKRLVRRLTSWYVEPALEGQRTFNADITRAVNELERFVILYMEANTGLQRIIAELEAGRRDLEIRLDQLEDVMGRELDHLPLPPKHLQERVVGVYVPGFFTSGFQMYDQFNGVLAKAGRQLSDFSDILDFGCGPGRTLRGLSKLLPSTRLYGTDIDPELIQWLKDNYSSIATFELNPPTPPMPFEDDSFDFVFSVSVFTHLPEEMQFAWLKDTARVTRPGGYLIHTIRAENCFEQINEKQRALVQENGFCYLNIMDTDGLPEFYQTAYHSHDYIRKEWGKYFEVVDIVEYGVAHNQDAVLLRNR